MHDFIKCQTKVEKVKVLKNQCLLSLMFSWRIIVKIVFAIENHFKMRNYEQNRYSQCLQHWPYHRCCSECGKQRPFGRLNIRRNFSMPYTRITFPNSIKTTEPSTSQTATEGGLTSPTEKSSAASADSDRRTRGRVPCPGWQCGQGTRPLVRQSASIGFRLSVMIAYPLGAVFTVVVVGASLYRGNRKAVTVTSGWPVPVSSVKLTGGTFPSTQPFGWCAVNGTRV